MITKAVIINHPTTWRTCVHTLCTVAHHAATSSFSRLSHEDDEDISRELSCGSLWATPHPFQRARSSAPPPHHAESHSTTWRQSGSFSLRRRYMRSSVLRRWHSRLKSSSSDSRTRIRSRRTAFWAMMGSEEGVGSGMASREGGVGVVELWIAMDAPPRTHHRVTPCFATSSSSLSFSRRPPQQPPCPRPSRATACTAPRRPR